MNLPYQTILDGAALGQFWEFVKFFLFYIAPIIMIFFALQLVGWVIRTVRSSMQKAEHDDDYGDYEGRRRRDDDW